MKIKISQVKFSIYIDKSGVVEVYAYVNKRNIYERCFMDISEVSIPNILIELGIEL
jgi:hypothetical protein